MLQPVKKMAVVHDWLIEVGGAEKVLSAILALYPNAHLFTLVKSEKILKMVSIFPPSITTSFIQWFPFVKKNYRNYLPFFPMAIESFDLSSYDLIISSSHAVAKGIRTHRKQLHICYCHTPARYLWSDQYKRQMSRIKSLLAKPILDYIKKWDLKTLDRVDYFIANSNYIGNRIKESYGLSTETIYPPVSTHRFQVGYHRDDFYLTVSRLVCYKRIDLIIEAFNQMPLKRLYVIGRGPELKNLKKKARSNIHFLGFQPDEQLHGYLEKAKALIFAAEEDFGIVPVEAQAAGTPVIAYGKGGVLETVIPYKTGLFFAEQEVESMIKTINDFETHSFDPNLIRSNAERFGEARFKKEFDSFIKKKWEEFSENRRNRKTF